MNWPIWPFQKNVTLQHQILPPEHLNLLLLNFEQSCAFVCKPPFHTSYKISLSSKCLKPHLLLSLSLSCLKTQKWKVHFYLVFHMLITAASNILYSSVLTYKSNLFHGHTQILSLQWNERKCQPHRNTPKNSCLFYQKNTVITRL